jgi:hypothetical protein
MGEKRRSKTDSLSDIEKIFFENAIQDRHNNNTYRQNILNFCIVINVALIGGMYIINECASFNLFNLPHTKILSVIQFISNLLFFTMYVREHKVATIREQVFENVFKKYKKHNIDQYLLSVSYADFLNQELTWKIVRMIFCFLLLFPIYVFYKLSISWHSIIVLIIMIIFIYCNLLYTFIALTFKLLIKIVNCKCLQWIPRCIEKCYRFFCVDKTFKETHMNKGYDEGCIDIVRIDYFNKKYL